jgi:hypothetical protein
VYGDLRKIVIISKQWSQWSGFKTKIAKEAVQIILNTSFWTCVRTIMKLCTKPILEILRLVDKECARMGLIYELKLII